MKRLVLVSVSILILFVLIAQCTSQKTVGHPYEVRGQYYDYDPKVPLITGGDMLVAVVNSQSTINDFNSYNDLHNQYNYQCFSLKNEGTAALTTAQSASAGTSSREQLLNFYSLALDAIHREENCQESIRVMQKHSLKIISEINNWNQLSNELNKNIQISKSDENAEMNNYNNIASNFNNAITSCSNDNQVLGKDGMCHNICESPNIYCS
jgi:hypothetical protein